MRERAERSVNIGDDSLPGPWKLVNPSAPNRGNAIKPGGLTDSCSEPLILHLGEERFKHLTVNALIGNLASCLDSSKSGVYKLTPEAYSYNERNFRANEIDNVLAERLGLKKIWQKLARRPKLVSWSGASHPDTVENLARRTLDTCIGRRNAIIHRGRSYYTPGPSEVIECAKFFAILIECTGEVMTDYKAL
jgi:hypothetical protein